MILRYEVLWCLGLRQMRGDGYLVHVRAKLDLIHGYLHGIDARRNLPVREEAA